MFSKQERGGFLLKEKKNCHSVFTSFPESPGWEINGHLPRVVTSECAVWDPAGKKKKMPYFTMIQTFPAWESTWPCCLQNFFPWEINRKYSIQAEETK